MANEIRREMTRMLINIWDDRDFLIGVNTHLKTDGHIRKMINWLDKHSNEKLESDEVALKALEIKDDKKYEVNGLMTRD